MKKRKPKTFDEATAEQTPAEQTPAEQTPAAQTPAEDMPHQHLGPDVVKDELTRVKQERDKHYEQLQRTLADLQNFRKRRGQEMAEIRMLAVEGLAAELLPVLDNFHLATDAAKDADNDAANADNADNAEGDGAKAVREGLAMVKAMLEGVLERHGLREIPAAGQAFDHTLHEAVGLCDSTDVQPGQVAKVILTGYFLGDRVLRHAKVLVAGDMPAKPEGDVHEGDD